MLVRATGFAISALLVSAVWLGHGISSISVILLVISLIGLAVVRENISALTTEEKILTGLFLLFSAYSLLSWYLSGMDEDGVKHLGKHLRFAIILPVYFWFRRIDVSLAWVVSSASIGAILAMMVALYEVFYLGIPRAHGVHHPIMFGDLALIMGFLAFVGRSALTEKLLRYLPHLAIASGLIASMLSASRGAWIAIPALTLILLWQHWRSFGCWAKAAIVGLIIVLPVVAYIVPQSGVKQRIDVASSDISLYVSGETVNTSLGLRFEAWRSAFYIAEQYPVFGAGLGRFNDMSQHLIEQGKVQQGAANFTHTHNDYLTQLAVNGVVGLILLLAIYLYPARLFIQRLGSADSDAATAALMGLCLIVAFMHYSLSESMMIRSAPVSFYTVLLLYLVSVVFKHEYRKI